VETFHQAQAAPVEQLAHQLVIARETGDDAADLFAREDDRQVRGAAGAGWLDCAEVLLEDFAVEEEDGGEGLVLGGGGDIFLDGQVSEEGFNLREGRPFRRGGVCCGRGCSGGSS